MDITATRHGAGAGLSAGLSVGAARSAPPMPAGDDMSRRRA